MSAGGKLVRKLQVGTLTPALNAGRGEKVLKAPKLLSDKISTCDQNKSTATLRIRLGGESSRQLTRKNK